LDLGHRLRTIRKSKGLTLHQVHELTSISRATLSLWENNKVQPTMSALERWANGVGIDVWDIFFDSEHEMTPEEISLLEMFRQLTPQNQVQIYNLVKSLPKRKE